MSTILTILSLTSLKMLQKIVGTVVIKVSQNTQQIA